MPPDPKRGEGADVEVARQQPRQFAMVPAEVIRHLECANCVHLYAFLDLKQGNGGRPARGLESIAAPLGWQHATVRKHVQHLVAAGLIALDPPPQPGRGWSKVQFRVAYNPARRRLCPTNLVPKVWVEKPARRWRPPNNLHSLRARVDAARDAPSVLSSVDANDARCVAALARGVPHLGEQFHAERVAPSVSSSAMRSEKSSEKSSGPRLPRCVACGGYLPAVANYITDSEEFCDCAF